MRIIDWSLGVFHSFIDLERAFLQTYLPLIPLSFCSLWNAILFLDFVVNYGNTGMDLAITKTACNNFSKSQILLSTFKAQTSALHHVPLQPMASRPPPYLNVPNEIWDIIFSYGFVQKDFLMLSLINKAFNKAVEPSLYSYFSWVPKPKRGCV